MIDLRSSGYGFVPMIDLRSSGYGFVSRKCFKLWRKYKRVISKYIVILLCFVSLRDSLSLAESIEKSRLQEEAAVDPTVINKSSIITQSYKNKRRVCFVLY